MSLFIKNSSGKPSASLTLSIIAFVITALWFLLSFLNIKIHGWSVREFDASAAVSFMAPCLALYFGRRSIEAGALPEKPKE